MLAIVQRITDFLPISSSAFLFVLLVFNGLNDQWRALDIAMHIGTFVAVIFISS